MASDEQSLQALEQLMNEFFGTHTTNERKRVIEELLTNFRNQDGCWKQCLYYMSSTTNEYVLMYCLSVLETIINKHWLRMLGENKGEIRSSLYRFLLAKHNIVPTFVRNKICKLVVDIGRLDWPHFYPDFFSNILQLSQSSDTCLLGLVILKTASEELASPRDDLSMSRKQELQRLLLEQVPNVLVILSNILDSILEKHRHLVTATPPPSPTHGQSQTVSSSPLQQGNLLSSMFKSFTKSPFQSLPPLDPESHLICIQALGCLEHLFSWIPLSLHISPALLTTVFHYASFGCDPLPKHSDSLNAEHIHRTTDKSELGVLAMSCINEIMSKNCVPADFEEFLMHMFQNTFYILQILTQDNNSMTLHSGSNRLEELNESYLDKFTEFLRLFVSVHLHRFEENSQFPTLQFLSLLFNYTFQQPTLEGFYSCLDIWSIFLDFLSTKVSSKNFDSNSAIARYKEALVSLVADILRKSLFKLNQTSLEELDDEVLDDNLQTEWQRFLQHCIETIAKVAELIPEEVYAQLFPLFEKDLGIYLELEQYIMYQDGIQEPCLQVTAENECRRLHCSLRDLSSLLQAIGRLVDCFSTKPFWDKFSSTHSTLNRICQAASYSTRMKCYSLKTAAPNVLQTDFIEVHAQILATLKAFCHWIYLLYSECLQKNQQVNDLANLIKAIIEAAIPAIINETPEKITHSASHLLLSVTTIRPAFLFSLPLIQQLFTKVCERRMRSLPFQTELLVYRSLHNMLCLPWLNVPDADQDWNSRGNHYQHFINALTCVLAQIRSEPSFSENRQLQQQVKPAVRWTVLVMHSLVDNLEDSSTRTKQLCYQSLQEVIRSIVGLFPLYLMHKDITEAILDFLLSVFKNLQTQMGVAFAEQTVQTFLRIFTKEQLSECILNEGSTGIRVVEKFLKLLEQIVQEPGFAFKTFLPSIVDLAMDQLYPVVAERPSPDIKHGLFELLSQILLHNWRYFFVSNVVATLSGNENIEHQDQFVKIMQAFGQSFLQPDINVFRHNLEALEGLNKKWKLYHKGLFKSVMLPQFLTVFLQCLATRSHDLLKEEINIAIYNMASVDFEYFYRTFLPQFLTNHEGLDDNQKQFLGQNFKMEMDLPSFTQSIQNFINDLRYYHLCNSTLPAGSVQL